MKVRCLCLILVLLLFISCTHDGELSIADSQESTIAPIMSEMVSAIHMDIGTSEETDAGESFSVRYRRIYAKTDLTEKYADLNLGDGIAFFSDEKLHIFVPAEKTGDRIPYLHVLDNHGEIIHSIAVPQPKDIVQLCFAQKLSDGTFVILFKTDGKHNTKDQYLGFMDADGNVLRKTYLHSYPMVSDIKVFERETLHGTRELYLFAAKYDGCIYYYDKQLKESVVSGSMFPGKVIDTNRVETGSYVADRKTVHLVSGETKEYPLRLPDSCNAVNMLYSADGTLYLLDTNGIYRYQAGEMPDCIHWFQDSGFSRDYAVCQTILIMDDQSIYVAEPENRAIYLYKSELVPDTADVTEIEVYVIGGTAVKGWLDRAVFAFNQKHSDYRVKIDYFSPRKDGTVTLLNPQYEAELAELFLYREHPDVLLIENNRMLWPYFEKDIFLNLNTVTDAELLGCITRSYGYNGALYAVPLMTQMSTLAANCDFIDSALTYEQFFSAMQTISDGEVLTGSPVSAAVYHNIIMDFVDIPGKISQYNTDAFRYCLEQICDLNKRESELIDRNAGAVSFGSQLGENGGSLGSDGKYWTQNGTVGAALQNGTMKFLSVDFSGITAFNAVKLLFGDTEFSFCGYPRLEGFGVTITDFLSAAVMWDTDVPDGCKAWLNHMLSDEWQTDQALLNVYLPVTVSAMDAAISMNRFSYYTKSDMARIRARDTTDLVYLSPIGTSSVYDVQFNGAQNTAEVYEVLEITDAEKQMLLDFFDRAYMHTFTDPFIKEIVEEEVSFWEGSARTLEETTKIIDSRVWIYLNE